MVFYAVVDHMTQDVIFTESHLEDGCILNIDGKEFVKKYGIRLVDIAKISDKLAIKKSIFIDDKTDYREFL
jgi:hypothetical protein